VNNQYEDDQRMHFVRKAHRLWWGFALLELLTVGLLALIVYQHEPTPLPLPFPMFDPVFGGIVVYLTGALVGVFNWAFQESNTSRSVEDYGLFRAELFVSMGLSGIAAVGGVLVTVMLAGTLEASVVQPRSDVTPAPVTGTVTLATTLPTSTATPTPPATPTAITAPQEKPGLLLGDAFTLARYPYAVLLAIIFGFSPRLLVDRLTKASSELTRDFKSIQAA
jgi:hypothetical protein